MLIREKLIWKAEMSIPKVFSGFRPGDKVLSCSLNQSKSLMKSADAHFMKKKINLSGWRLLSFPLLREKLNLMTCSLRAATHHFKRQLHTRTEKWDWFLKVERTSTKWILDRHFIFYEKLVQNSWQDLPRSSKCHRRSTSLQALWHLWQWQKGFTISYERCSPLWTYRAYSKLKHNYCSQILNVQVAVNVEIYPQQIITLLHNIKI